MEENNLTKSTVKSLLKERESSTHKGNYGHALLIAGKKGTMGAAVIASKAAIRSGVGLLTVCVPEAERIILQTSVPEAMLIMREDQPLQFDKFSALGIGPGFGIDKTSEELFTNVLQEFKKPLLLDADAFTLISNNKELLAELAEETILTPHGGEFDRLFGVHSTNDDRITTAVQKAKEYRIIIVLKGHRTAIVTPEDVFYNSTGNAGLAKGGSGDALTGLITSFLAQGYPPVTAAKLGVFLHGLAADLTLAEQSMESMVITDVIEYFGKAFSAIRE